MRTKQKYVNKHTPLLCTSKWVKKYTDIQKSLMENIVSIYSYNGFCRLNQDASSAKICSAIAILPL